MRRIFPAFIAFLGCAAAFPGSALGASVLVVGEHGTHERQEPIPRLASRLPKPTEPTPKPRPRVALPATGSAAATARADAVPRTVRRAAARKQISESERARYLSNYSAALAAYRKLGGSRRAELGYVIGVTQSLARTRRLDASRMPIVFLNLQRNTEWWRKAGPPPSGKRLQFGGSRVIFQYFPGHGLQFHPLANFGELNGYWYANNRPNMRSLADDLVSLHVERNGFVAWEYYFAFGGGSPPWISGMAQGTAMQSLARVSQKLADPSLLAIARRARGSFERRVPTGVRVPASTGVWYALYNFDPHQNVLNGMLQAINGLRTYAEIAKDDQADALFATGDKLARSVIRSYDTGAWSLYNRPGGRPGYEANLNYHTLNRDFARNLCKGTGIEVYCTEADNFTKYLKQDPKFGDYRAVPSPARAGKGVRVKFNLSKISSVAITIRNDDGKTVYSNSATLAHGPHFFRWVPAKLKAEHDYSFQLSARDLAGNGNTVEGDVTVRP